MLTVDDLNEIMDDQYSVNGCRSKGGLQKVENYDVLLRSITDIGKLIDDSEKIEVSSQPLKQSQELTADLFANMSDNEVFSHLLPVNDIDFGRVNTGSNNDLKKKDKLDQDEFSPLIFEDFGISQSLQYLNPMYNYLCEKPKLNNAPRQKPSKDSIKEKEIDVEIEEEIDLDQDEREEELDNKKSSKDNKKPEGKVIKRRKPRTYKYNPKPLQQKGGRSFVPDDLKDPDYWAHRKRNNEAAKKSREERRKKELELLKSYEIMQQEYSQINIENIRLKARNSMLEKQLAELKCEMNEKKRN